MRRKLFKLGLSVFFISQLTACINSRPVFIQLMFDNKLLYNCAGAKITKRENSGHAGFDFHCGNSAVGVVYDTNVRKDGTVKRIEIHYFNRDGQIIGSQNLEPAVKVNIRGAPNCPSAKALNRSTGETPFPTDFFGNIIIGTYRFEMSEPCGTLFVTMQESSTQ